jgi:hypothetical protein
VRSADNLTTFMCRLSRNLGASTSWNPKGLSRPLQGLLYLYVKGYYNCSSINYHVKFTLKIHSHISEKVNSLNDHIDLNTVVVALEKATLPMLCHCTTTTAETELNGTFRQQSRQRDRDWKCFSSDCKYRVSPIQQSVYWIRMV